jgi:hypothetical protein
MNETYISIQPINLNIISELIDKINIIHNSLLNITREKNKFLNILANIIAIDSHHKLENHILLLESKQIDLILINFYNVKQICFLIKYSFNTEYFNLNLYLELYEYYYVLYKFNIYKYDLINITPEQIKKIISQIYLIKLFTKSYCKKKYHKNIYDE